MSKLFQIATTMLILLQFIAFGQERLSSVTGIVVDRSQQPLPGITILIDNTSKGTATNSQGQFQITNMMPGSYTLLVSGIGFQKKQIEVTLSAGDYKKLEIQLEDESLQLKEAIIYGKSESTVLKEKGFAVNAIETKDIEFQSIQANDLLDRSAGVRIRQDGGMGSKVRYNINGLSGNSIRIFLNGIPIENYGSSFSLSSIPTSLIERIEVFKGVVPAHLGDDALGGAINVVTKTNAPNTLNASYSFGSFNTHQGSINGNYRNNKSGLTFRGSAFYNYSDNNYKVWGNKVYVTSTDMDNNFGKKTYIEAERFHDSYRSTGADFNFGFSDVKWADQAFIGLLVSDMAKDIQHGATMEIVYGNRKMEQSTQLFNAKYKKEDFLIKGLEADFFISYSNLRRKVIDTIPYMYNWRGELSYNKTTNSWYEWQSGAEGSDPTLNEDHEKKFTSRLFLTYSLNDYNRFSVNYLSSNFKRNPDDPYRPMDERVLSDIRGLVKNIIGVAYENESFQDKLKTSIFFKYYHQDMSFENPHRVDGVVVTNKIKNLIAKSGYGIALSYELTPELQILASAENALRLPESNELFGNSAENIEMSVSLEPERSFNTNLGINIGPFNHGKHSVRFNTNLFYRDIRDQIRPGPPHPTDETFTYQNLNKVLSKGIDAEFSYSYGSQFYWVLNGSLTKMIFNKEYDAYGARYSYYKVRLPNEPYFTLNSNFRYNMNNLIQKSSKASVYYNIGYVHEFYRNWENYGGANKDIIPSQLVNDIGVSYTLPSERLTVSFDAKNIFNEQVFDNWAQQKPGRAFYLKLNYKLINN